MIGRKKEMGKIQRLLISERSEFLAVTGRRRVGKTFLIDALLKEHYCFSMIGIQNGNVAAQLVNFSAKLAEYDGTLTPKHFENWQIAFIHLKTLFRTGRATPIPHTTPSVHTLPELSADAPTPTARHAGSSGCDALPKNFLLSLSGEPMSQSHPR